MKVVIIGGVAGGATAAARLRRLDESAQIIIIERSGYISYANCGLPYYISGVIAHREALTLQTPESFWERFRIDARVNQEALSIDPGKKTVTIRKLEDGSLYEESYDDLILSPGAKAIRPALPGIDHPRIHTLRTVEDALFLREAAVSKGVQKAVIIGGGFIGLEMAENLVHAGIKTTLLQRSGKVMPPLDGDMASQLHLYMRKKGIDLQLNAPVRGFSPAPDQVFIQLKDGRELPADLVILSIGVQPDSHLAKEAGLALGEKGAIIVDEGMRTSQPHIYAVGDAVQIRHFVSGRPALVSLAGPANKQGRIAADQICGKHSVYTGAQGSSVLKMFDMTVAATGLNETAAKAAGIPYDKVVTFSASHATYYPGAENMTVKTLFSTRTGQILGAQIIGFQGVDKRIDVLATGIRARMTGHDLTELDLAYAPAYSSAKDPVNMAGFVIENLQQGLVRQFHWDQVSSLAQDPSVTLLDVRTPEEFAQGHIPGALHIPLDALRENLSILEQWKKIYVYCYSGLRSYIACRILTGLGFEVWNLSGGYRFYRFNSDQVSYDESPRFPCGLPL